MTSACVIYFYLFIFEIVLLFIGLFIVEIMTDDSKRLAIEGPKTLALRATFINGSVVVESKEDIERKRAERAKKRKSRWDNQGGSSSTSSSTAVVPLGTNITAQHKQKYK